MCEVEQGIELTYAHTGDALMAEDEVEVKEEDDMQLDPVEELKKEKKITKALNARVKKLEAAALDAEQAKSAVLAFALKCGEKLIGVYVCVCACVCVCVCVCMCGVALTAKRSSCWTSGQVDGQVEGHEECSKVEAR